MVRRIGLWVAILAGVTGAAAAETLEQERQARFRTLKRLAAPTRHSIREQAYRQEAVHLASDRDPTDVVLRRTAALLAHLKKMPGAQDLSVEQRRLDDLERQVGQAGVRNEPERHRLFGEILKLRRKIAFSNPLLDFGRILFVKRHFLPDHHRVGNHMCDQYFGFHAIRGGGLFVLENALETGPEARWRVRDVLAESACENGRFQGRKLPPGGYLSPDLSYDGRTVLFAYTEAEPTPYKWTEKSTFHIFKVNVDGSSLVQLTDGPVNDFDPCWLPNGRIVFISERRGGYGRCHARPVPIFTLHTMHPDGSDVVCISYGESNEWHPSVDHNGMVVYTRWDYMDRGHSQAHHPWITTPDGRDARAMQGNFGKSMRARPFMEMDVRAIPGAQRYVATAAAHHGQAYGSLIVIDPAIQDDDAMSPLKRLTPEVPFPEAEAGSRTGQVYGTPWPLDEVFYLCVYDGNANGARGPANNYGIYLLDAFGNKELIYRDPAISCLSPIPLRPRNRPPVVPHVTTVGRPRSERPVRGADEGGEQRTAPVSVISVYDGLLPWPEGTRIKALRILQVLPKTTPHHHRPRIGYGLEKSARAVLGTVPVESDGSAHFSLPVGKPVFFQTLDERGRAVQSMRSVTYVHPGQRLVCQGCHEPRHRSPRVRDFPLALRRSPSKIRPDVDGSNPFSFPRLVQPVLDRHCVSCHEEEPEARSLARGNVEKNLHHWYTSYINLRPYAFYFGQFDADYDGWTAPRTRPGQFGARASKLLRIIEQGHYDVRLPVQDLHRITLWLDSNSDFFGSYEDTEAQARGEIVRPSLE